MATIEVQGKCMIKETKSITFRSRNFSINVATGNLTFDTTSQ